MHKEKIKEILERIKTGDLSVEEGMQVLQNLPYEDMGFAMLDHHRSLRKGFPEVVFCENKTTEQAVQIISRLALHNDVLATRSNEEQYKAVAAKFPKAEYNELARTIVVPYGAEQKPGDESKTILVISAGTSDIPVAEEAVVTAKIMGNRVESLYDVGVAGLHRLLSNKPKIDAANVIVVVAGMDGALPSVVAGLVNVPVIAVPTSVGYGASFSGIGPLLTMLNACAPGVTVVNIDNGFGAGYFASLVNR